jgi:hypothetical protein
MNSMKKYVIISLAVVGVGMIVLVLIGYRVLGKESPNASMNQQQAMSGPTLVHLTIGDTTINAELVQSLVDITKGLSGRASLPDGQGMLFVMPYSAQHKFWMPDMHFAIDIIWFDETFKVVDVTDNVTPESYPKTFMPRTPALYVLEVPTGYAAAHTIKAGEQAVLRR